MMRAIIFSLMIALSVNASAQSVKAGKKDGKLQTDKIIDSVLQCTDCLDWKLLGMCFWLRCSLYSCEVETSVRVGHYIPEFVVSSYTFQSDWEDTKDWNDNPSGAIAKTEDDAEQDTSLDFKSVDIISHPATWIFDTLGSNEYFCESANDMPMLPHFLSSYDPNWNDPTIEQLYPQAILGNPKIHTSTKAMDEPLNTMYPQHSVPWQDSWKWKDYWWARGTDDSLYLYVIFKEEESIELPLLGKGYWAPLYPRCGWGAHPYDPINAAVAAHRAAEIVTRSVQPHVYWPAQGSCENKCWNPGPVSIGGNDNRFQMILPKAVNSHGTFGGAATWANGKHKPRETYMWNLWRYYACCEAKGAYIEKIDFN